MIVVALVIVVMLWWVRLGLFASYALVMVVICGECDYLVVCGDVWVLLSSIMIVWGVMSAVVARKRRV